jgi:CHAD domain-containing protein
MVEEGFDRKEILSAIDDVLAGKEPPSKLSKHLAQIRKGLKTLRFAYEAFDVHHEIPESLNRLIIKLGHLDDALKSHSPRVAQEEAKTIKAALKKKNLKESFESAKSFEPETEEGFWRWEKSARATITNALNAGDVSAVEFHDVRKTLGRYFTVLNAQQVYQPVENGDGVIRFTNKLYQDLGDFHDKMEAAKMEELQKALQASEKLTSAKKQQIVDAADAARVQFTPELRTGLTQFLDSLKP